MSPDPILAIQGVSHRFGGLVALNNVTLEIPRRSLFALIGPNGSCKTTLFNVITGLLSPAAGTIRLDGRPITGAPTHEIVRLGIWHHRQGQRESQPRSQLRPRAEQLQPLPVHLGQR